MAAKTIVVFLISIGYSSAGAYLSAGSTNYESALTRRCFDPRPVHYSLSNQHSHCTIACVRAICCICQGATGGVATGKKLVLRMRKRTQTSQLCAPCIGCGNIRLPIVISGGNSSSCSTSIAATIAVVRIPEKGQTHSN